MLEPTKVNLTDVMQVCRNGHVITDRLHADPEGGLGHCPRCGTITLDRCPTCGQELAGAPTIPGLLAIGGRKPPAYCSTCGAPFPWTGKPRPLGLGTRGQLEHLLRRLPLVIRQLRWRQGEGVPFRVTDERDLEDLVRALLPLYGDDIRPETRTPRYDARTRTDFLLVPEQLALTLKLARTTTAESQLVAQFQEDAAYWQQQPACRTLIGLVYDREGTIRDPLGLEAACSSREEGWEVRCVVAGLCPG
jgi:hypothetical protein